MKSSVGYTLAALAGFAMVTTCMIWMPKNLAQHKSTDARIQQEGIHPQGLARHTESGNPELSRLHNEAYDLVRQAESSLYLGDAREAISECEQALSKNPHSADAYFVLAQACEKTNDPPRAIEAYRVYFYRLNREANADKWMRFVLLLDRTGQTKEALNVYQEGCQRSEEEIKTNLPELSGSYSHAKMQAAAHLVLYRYEKFYNRNVAAANEHLKQAVTLDPTLGPARYYMGKIVYVSDWRNPTEKTLRTAREHYAAAVKYTKGNLKPMAEKNLREMEDLLKHLPANSESSAVAKPL
jgi:tetratricopeptide (TPR) repeat protein